MTTLRVDVSIKNNQFHFSLQISFSVDEMHNFQCQIKNTHNNCTLELAYGVRACHDSTVSMRTSTCNHQTRGSTATIQQLVQPSNNHPESDYTSSNHLCPNRECLLVLGPFRLCTSYRATKFQALDNISC